MLITDTTLLRLAPHVFSDASDLATILIDGTDGVVSGSQFTSAGSDFTINDIDTGNVIVIDGNPVEIDARQSATQLDVSRARASDADALIPPGDGSTLTFSVPTFERQIAEQQAWVLGALGIDPSHPETGLDETSIIDTADVEILIALRAIAHLYEVAAARAPTDDALAMQAAQWRTIERTQRHGTVVYLDLDGDGVPDATRRVDVVEFARR